MLNIVGAAAATKDGLPPIAATGYEYVVAANGVFIRAQSLYISACVPVRPYFGDRIERLQPVESFAKLLWAPPVGIGHLYAVIDNARNRMPNEAMYQFIRKVDEQEDTHKWVCKIPRQNATPTRVDFEDNPDSIIDIHSHNTMTAFFSEQDNADELGFRFYCVLGKLDTDYPQILCRVGVYGYFMNVPMTTIFKDSVASPIVDLYNQNDR